MPFPLSPRSIEAIAYIISGGPAGATKIIGIYRSGPDIERLMRNCNVDFSLSARGKVTGSRFPTLVNCLVELNRSSGSEETLSEIIEAATDPQDFVRDDERYNNVLNYLNSRLRDDGFELLKDGAKTRLVAADHSLPVVSELACLVETIGFDTVKRDMGRALDSVEDDPEGAITAACSTIESVCRSILFELGKDLSNKKDLLPKNKDVKGLFNAVKKPLGLSSDDSHMNPHVTAEMLATLGGLATVVQGVGALRTLGGDAHGRERGYGRTDARIARLSVHAASAVSLFLIETWQHKFPQRALHRHDEPD